MGKEELAKSALAAVDRDFRPYEQIKSAGRRAAPLASMYFHLARLSKVPSMPALGQIFELSELQKPAPEQAAEVAELYLEFAMLTRSAKLPHARTIAALSHAVRLRPDYLKAHAELGYTLLDAGDLAASRGSFEKVPPTSEFASHALNGFCGIAVAHLDASRYDDAASVAESSSPWVRTPFDSNQRLQTAVHIGQTAARVYLKSGNLDQARKHATFARRHASDKVTIDELDRIVELSGARAGGQFAARAGETIQRVLGTIQALECTPKGGLLKVLVMGKAALFDLPPPDSVEVTGTAAASLELRCGTLKPMPVQLEYTPPGIIRADSLGVIRRMEFE